MPSLPFRLVLLQEEAVFPASFLPHATPFLLLTELPEVCVLESWDTALKCLGFVIFTQGWLSFSDFTAAKELGHLWRCRGCNEDPLLGEGGSALGFPFNLAGLCWFQVLAYHLVLQACSIQHVTFSPRCLCPLLCSVCNSPGFIYIAFCRVVLQTGLLGWLQLKITPFFSFLVICAWPTVRDSKKTARQ